MNTPKSVPKQKQRRENDGLDEREQEKWCLKLAKQFYKVFKSQGKIESKKELDIYDKIIEQSDIPSNVLREIEQILATKNFTYRPVDIYRYW